MNIVLWILQILLGLLFLFAGGMKLVVAPEVLAQMGSPDDIRLPNLLLWFIGVCEVLGGLGLILPGLFRTHQYLTPLAAAGLFIILLGATVLTIAGPGPASAIAPLVFCLLCAVVAYGRWRMVPLGSRA